MVDSVSLQNDELAAGDVAQASLLAGIRGLNRLKSRPPAPPSRTERIVTAASYQAGYVAGSCWSWLLSAAFNAREGFDEGAHAK